MAKRVTYIEYDAHWEVRFNDRIWGVIIYNHAKERFEFYSELGVFKHREGLPKYWDSLFHAKRDISKVIKSMFNQICYFNLKTAKFYGATDSS